MSAPQQQVPVFVISLARAAERRRDVCQHMQDLGIDFELFDAVDGGALDPAQIETIMSPGLEMHKGTIGCYLSHIGVYQRILSQQHEVALILEDDARLSPKVKKLLAQRLQFLDFDYCFLDSDDHNEEGFVYYNLDSARQISADFRCFELSAGPQTLHAYLITKAGASKRVAHAYPLRKPIDIYEHLPYPISFRSIVKPKLAWVSAHSLTSSTSLRTDNASNLAFASLRRWPAFYIFRDLIRLTGLRRNLAVRKLVRNGVLPKLGRWRALPFGREVLMTGRSTS